MTQIADSKTILVAMDHLSKNDPVMARVITQFGTCTIKPHRNYYQELVDSIISQQLSVKAAQTIQKRFCELFASDKIPEPEKIISKSIEELRTAGLSNAKARYIQDLAAHVLDGSLRFDTLDQLANDEIVKELTRIKGIGEWTAHMFMMFCMGRTDILPVGDLGIKNGMMQLYGLESVPTPDHMRTIASENSWHPYESIASWYVWQSLDNVPKIL